MPAEGKETEKQKRQLFSRGTLFNLVAVSIFTLGIYFCYCLYRTADNIVPTNNRIAETLYTICHPIKDKYDIKDYIVTPFGDGSMDVEYIINRPELAFDIVREIDTLRKDSIYLSKAQIHIHIRSAQPDGLDFRVELPGELGYKSKRDDKLYRELNIDRFKWQEFREGNRKKYPESEKTDGDPAPADNDAAAETTADSTK